jgi:hypothetical protein
MATVTKSDPRVRSVEVTNASITMHLMDGRAISVPLAWSWRLIGDGDGIHWPDIDEDLSVRGMLDGIPARRPSPH